MKLPGILCLTGWVIGEGIIGLKPLLVSSPTSLKLAEVAKATVIVGVIDLGGRYRKVDADRWSPAKVGLGLARTTCKQPPSGDLPPVQVSNPGLCHRYLNLRGMRRGRVTPFNLGSR